MKEKWEIIFEEVKTLQNSVEALLLDTWAKGSCGSDLVRDLEQLNAKLLRSIRALEEEKISRDMLKTCIFVG